VSSVETSLRVAFDIGGTFTDVLVAAADGRLFTFKILTLPDSIGVDVDRCVNEAIAATASGRVEGIVHGTTVASNAVLEGKGALTGLITTRGFRDELEIRRFGRPGVYDVFWERIPPLIPRRRRLEVGERMRASGEVERPLDRAEMLRAIEALRTQQVEAIAVSFVHSYVNPAHEQEAIALIRELMPQVAACASSEVLPEIREYERTSTTALNAHLMPVVARYLDQLELQLARHHREILIMQSNGGVMTADRARNRPAHMIESGPAAGVLAAASLARAVELNQAVAFDMGGTTVKTCLIENGQPVESPEGEVGGGINISGRLSRGAGYALRVPAYDIVEVGAGGGSLAWRDAGGVMRVGPRSAGAVPGPACYGNGGVEPTVTDASVVLGYMNPERIAGGAVPIHLDAAHRAIDEKLARPLGLTLKSAAHGVHRVANATMSRAIRAVTTERGRDPREFTLIAFGGAGPIHAAELARTLGITRVYIPLFPGLFSALGLMLAELRYDHVQSRPGLLDSFEARALLAQYDSMVRRFGDEVFGSQADGRVRFERFIDLRYARQSSELTLGIPAGVTASEIRNIIAQAFHSEHERAYGYRRDHEPIAVTSLRLRAIAPAGQLNFADLASSFAQSKNSEREGSSISRKAYFGPDAGEVDAGVISRAALSQHPLSGPLVIEEFDTTVVVPPGWLAELDSYGNIILTS
jgi:N-methylhydantoinase A